jgi:hypothetical protein
LFNKSLRIGVVPFDWKLANVVPAHKKGDQEFVENHRPISLLSLVSKVLERCVFNTTSQAMIFIMLEARKNPGYRWSRDSSFPPKIWGKIKIVLREWWKRSALKFIEIFPHSIVILVAICDY